MHYILDKAREYAHLAVAADKRGNYEDAVKYYKLAINLFNKYLTLYPDSVMADAYRSLIREYMNRVKILEQHLSNTSTRVNSDLSNGNSIKLKEYDGSGVKFDDVVDLEEVKKALKRAVIYPLKTPDLYPLGWARGILLFGPPGCGKTFIVQALANEIKAVLIDVSPATIMSKWLGEAEKNVERVFTMAREIARKGRPVIIFIDEVDALFQEYGDEIGAEKRVREQFKIEMEGLKAKEDIKLPLFVIGATNKPWKLDIGFIRRFDKRIYVKPPDAEVRRKLFEYYINTLSKVFDTRDVDINVLVEQTENYSPDDIKKIVKEVQENIVEEIHESGSRTDRRITTEDFLKVIKSRKPSIDPKILQAYESWNSKFGAY